MQFRPDGEKIRRWREERFWSREHLADAAGIGLRTVQRIENGDKASRESVMALAAAFDGGFVMRWPLIWWTIAVVGHGLAVVIVELVTRYGRLDSA